MSAETFTAPQGVHGGSERVATKTPIASSPKVVPQSVVTGSRVEKPALERGVENEATPANSPIEVSESMLSGTSKAEVPLVPTITGQEMESRPAMADRGVQTPEEGQGTRPEIAPKQESGASFNPSKESRLQPEVLVSSAPRQTVPHRAASAPAQEAVTGGEIAGSSSPKAVKSEVQSSQPEEPGVRRQVAESMASAADSGSVADPEAFEPRAPAMHPRPVFDEALMQDQAIRPESEPAALILPHQAPSLSVPIYQASAEPAENLNAKTPTPGVGQRVGGDAAGSNALLTEQPAVVPGPVFDSALERQQTASQRSFDSRNVQDLGAAAYDVRPTLTPAKPEVTRQSDARSRTETAPGEVFHPPVVAPGTGESEARKSVAADRPVPARKDTEPLLERRSAPPTGGSVLNPASLSEGSAPAPAPNFVQRFEPALQDQAGGVGGNLKSSRGSELPRQQAAKAPESEIQRIGAFVPASPEPRVESPATGSSEASDRTLREDSGKGTSFEPTPTLRRDAVSEPVPANARPVQPKPVMERNDDLQATVAAPSEAPMASIRLDRSAAFVEPAGTASLPVDPSAVVTSPTLPGEGKQPAVTAGPIPMVPGATMAAPATRRTVEQAGPRSLGERTLNAASTLVRSESGQAQGFTDPQSIPTVTPSAMSEDNADPRGRDSRSGQTWDNPEIPAAGPAPAINPVAESVRTQLLPESDSAPIPVRQPSVTSVADSMGTVPPGKNDVRSGAVPAAHAHRSLETRDLQLGTPVASKEKTMAYEPTTDKFAGDGTQALPGDALRHSASLGGLDRSLMPVTALLSGLIPPAAPLEPATSPDAAAAAQRARMHESVDRLQSMMAAHATSVVMGHVDELRAVLRPDSGTEIHLHVRRDADRVEMTARCQGGDVAAWQSSWADLQQRLRTQGVALQALEVGARNPGSGVGSGTDPDRQRPQPQNLSAEDRESGRRESPNGRRTQSEPSATQEPVTRRPARRVTPRVAEYWA